ncbi:MAG: DUF86 domain-containing protein [Flavobacteriales bacterium]|jgi:uncharacterized protein with HEPN domain
MNEKVLKYLFDIKQAMDEIDSFFSGKEKRFVDYKNNMLLKRAIERNLEIIGEAVNKILTIDAEFPIENARKIVGLRNHIVHAYDNISDENIWGIIINHLPRLRQDVQSQIDAAE